MTAEKMFEKLGYKLVDNEKWLIHYRKKLPNVDFLNVVFDSDNKTYATGHIIANPFDEIQLEITPELHKTINKQCEELGWLD